MPGHGKSKQIRQSDSETAKILSNWRTGLTKHKENHGRFGLKATT
jgi:predicted secreted Zn-dependent protease